MGNGSASIGGINLKQDEGTYELFVGQAWTSGSSWTTFALDLDGKRTVYLDMDYDDARQLAALLLEATDNKDLAEAIPADIARREAAQQARMEALSKMTAIQRDADKAFNEATVAARAAHKAALDEAERLHGDAAGCRIGRTIILKEDDGQPPW